MSSEWPLWEIFIRGQHGLNHRHVGSLHAPDAEMAIQQISALMPYGGIDIVGPLPPELQYVTTLSAGIGAAGQAPDAVKDLIKYLGTPEAAAVIRAKGLEPG